MYPVVRMNIRAKAHEMGASYSNCVSKYVHIHVSRSNLSVGWELLEGPVEPLFHSQFRLRISLATSVRTFPSGVEHRAPESLGDISMCSRYIHTCR